MMKLKFSALLLVSLSLYGLIAHAETSSPWLVRLRAIDVMPDPSSSTISLVGGHVTHVSDRVTPELDFSYFFNANIAAELILATSRHHVEATHTILGTVDLGKVNALPPTLTLQYHFFPEKTLNPYVGAGINVTHFFNVNNGPVATSTHYGNSFGPALQLGTDIALNKNWFINLDAKKIFMRPEVHVNTALGKLKTNVKLDPLVIGVGIGYQCN